MQKAKKFSRQILIFVLAIATALTCFLILQPDAQAADGDYTFRYQIYTSTYCDNAYLEIISQCTTYNGTSAGTESVSATAISSAKGYFPSNDGYTYSSDITAGGFPTTSNITIKVEHSFWSSRTAAGTITLQIKDADGNYVDAGSVDFSVTSTGGVGSDKTGTYSISTNSSVYPYVTTATFSNLADVKILSSGTNAGNYSVVAYDQYGVKWLNSPTTWYTTNSNTSISSNRVTYNNAANDYTNTVGATWSTANSSYSTVTKYSDTIKVWVLHTITINANGGTYSGTNPVYAYTGDVITLSTPTRDAYTFSNWSATSGTVSGSSFTVPDASPTVKADWSPNNYSISFNGNGGTIENDVNSTTYTIEDTNLSGKVPAVTREGYTFAGWKITASDNSTWTTGDIIDETTNPNGKWGNITVTAQWTANDYILSYDLNDSDRIGEANCGDSSKTVTYDSVVGSLPAPSMTAYEFAGWYTEAEGGTQVTESTVYTTADDSTVYAHWTPTEYTASFDANEGEEVADITYNIEEGTLPPPHKRGLYLCRLAG
ncbi:MAG: InlB B-repeat-containing protein [Clostridiales bacterium]|nr:InlB B-repeat-containing protein [Clostridiales bacterium]